MDHTSRRLGFHGVLLFLLGLVTGLAIQRFENPRMGLAAHLEGLMNGTFLLALGAAWHRVRLTPRLAAAGFGIALYGAYANWAATTIAAVFGTAAMTPLASGVHRGQGWQELLVAFGFGSVAVAMLAASAIILWGLRGRAADSEGQVIAGD
jgi:hydroxylaminobenzene mutase